MARKRNLCQTKPNKSKTKQKKTSGLTHDLKFELIGLGIITLASISLASFFTSAVGITGELTRKAFTIIAGGGRFFLPVALVFLGVKIMRERNNTRLTPGLLSIGILLFVSLTFMHMSIPLTDVFKAGMAGQGGGLLGATACYLLQKSFGPVGTYIVLASLFIVAILLFTGLTLKKLGNATMNKGRHVGGKAWHKLDNFLFETMPEETNTDPIRTNSVVPDPVLENKDNAETAATYTDKPIGNSSPKGSPAGAFTELIKERSEYKESVETSSAGDNEFNIPDEPLELSDGRVYSLPHTSLLARPTQQNNSAIEREIADKINILEKTLNNFGIAAKVTQVSVGPAITRYEIQPPAGVKVSRIVGLADDIALSMAAPDVRIEAPIPGKAAVGIEVPNREISMVCLRELLESKEFLEPVSRLTVALGKDIAGTPIVADLGRMPHLLVAGATGSGKSVCINTLVASILFRASPDEVKLLMIDPKMVELTTYNGIPHLISPVVTDSKKAAGTLRWAVKEMERRYELFAATGVRDIGRYNEMCAGITESENQRPLPYIVIIIDELADLMMVAPADVEDSICRLAQMARAAGMHLVVATQRPSVDVITGLIKANIPSRISFAVSSQTDSRTILDMGGAEKLLGKGDMLFFPVGAPKPLRVQGAFLSDKEVETVVNYLTKQAQPVYDEKVLEAQPVEESQKSDADYEDELLPQAVKILIENGNASISMLQRRLHIGYARAARLIDIMEQKGIVGGYEGSKPRSILMSLEQFHQTFNIVK